MSESTSLPVILVSARTESAASKLISDIIEEEYVSESKSNESSEREWTIENKYYTAQVALKPLGDEDRDDDVRDVEAHVVLLDAAEAEGGAVAARRLQRAAPPALALLAVDAARVPPALDAWAAAQRLEPVALRPPAAPPAAPPAPREPFAEERGVRRVREALHAHVWPGLRRRRGRAPAEPAADDDDMERFAAAAAALGAAARLPAAERRAAADSLLDTLCRALRIPLDEL